MSETPKPEFKRKPIRSFVIRGGRMTEAQQTAFDRYWADYRLRLADGPLDAETVFGRRAPLTLEIGFGMGDSLFTLAEQQPEQDFIGIEVHPPGVGRLLNRAGQAGLGNLRIYMADAQDVLEDCIADASVDRVLVYFPDPWPKKKHHKRRIIQADFVARVRRILKPGGLLHLATDWHDYAEWMMAVMTLAPGWRNTAGEYCFAERPDWRPVTKFERRGERLGHGVWDLLFARTDD